MKNNVTKLTKAFCFAAERHTDQRRKGAREEPYLNHLTDVAHRLATHTGDGDIDLLCAGVLHDTMEDTGTTHEELRREFGDAVADIVRECTDDKSLPKEVRKRLQAENAPHKSDRAKMVKIADKSSNLHSILTSPPPDWSDARKLEYVEWSKKVVDGCRGVNRGLEDDYDSLYRKGISKFQRPAA